MSEIKKTRSRSRAEFIAYTAMFASVCVLLNIYNLRFGIGNSVVISFTYIPTLLAGAFFGPLSGLITGLVGDLLGFIIAPSGAFNPVITVSSALMGLIPGLVFGVTKRIAGERVRLIIPAVISFLLVLFICTNLNTVGIYLYAIKGTGRTFWAFYVARTPKQVAVWAVNLIIGMALINPVSRLLKRSKGSKRQ